jgi:hypothetical protein
MHTDGKLKAAAPTVYKKIVDAAFGADAKHWQIMHEADGSRRPDIDVRTAEYHTVSDNGGIPEAKHRWVLRLRPWGAGLTTFITGT